MRKTPQLGQARALNARIGERKPFERRQSLKVFDSLISKSSSTEIQVFQSRQFRKRLEILVGGGLRDWKLWTGSVIERHIRDVRECVVAQTQSQKFWPRRRSFSVQGT